MMRMQIMLAVIAVIAIVSLAFDVVILFRLGDGSVSLTPSQVEIEQPSDSLGAQPGDEKDEKRELDDEQRRQESPRRSRGR